MFTDEEVKFIEGIQSRNDYTVKITLVKENDEGIMISVEYPNKTVDSYILLDVGAITYNTETIFIDIGLARLYIILDIFKKMRLAKWSLNIIQCFNMKNERIERIDDLFKPLTEGKSKLETKASEAISKIKNNRKLLHSFDEQMKRDNIYHSFNSLKGLLV